MRRWVMQGKKNKEKHLIGKWIKGRLRKKKNIIIVVVGPTGSGKSWTSLSIAKEADPSFDVGRVCFSAFEFMDLLENGVNGEKLKPGKAIVFEEAGVGINSRKFFSVINEVMYTVAETYRSSRLITIFNLPAFDSMDKRVRQLTHGLIETLDVDVDKKICLIKFFEINTNPVSGKIYRKHLTSGDYAFERHGIRMPEKELRMKYEVRKQEFRDGLQQGLMKKLHTSALKEQKEARKRNVDLDEVADKIRVDPGKFVKEHHGNYYVNQARIMAEFNVGRIHAKVIAAKVEDEILPNYPDSTPSVTK